MPAHWSFLALKLPEDEDPTNAQVRVKIAIEKAGADPTFTPPYSVEADHDRAPSYEEIERRMEVSRVGIMPMISDELTEAQIALHNAAAACVSVSDYSAASVILDILDEINDNHTMRFASGFQQGSGDEKEIYAERKRLFDEGKLPPDPQLRWG